MNRLKLSESCLCPNFIGSWIIQPSLCDNLITYYEKNNEKHVKGGTNKGINIEIKDRKDLCIYPKDLILPENEIVKDYFKYLFECYEDYNKQWPFLGKLINHVDIGQFNMGKYEAGQHFKKIHCERASLNTLHRLLAFMTYLNDVEDGGSTYFNHYDLDIKPKKGLTLLWPAEWTHSHKGNILKAGVKYIVTGWLCFPK